MFKRMITDTEAFISKYQHYNKTRSSLLQLSNREVALYLKSPTLINHIKSQDYADQYQSDIYIIIESCNSSNERYHEKKNTNNILLIPSHSSSQSNSQRNSLSQGEGRPRKKKIGKEKMKHFKVTNITVQNGFSMNKSFGDDSSSLDKSFDTVISTISHIEEKISESKEALQYFKGLIGKLKRPKASLITKEFKNSISLNPSGSNMPKMEMNNKNKKANTSSIMTLSKKDFLGVPSSNIITSNGNASSSDGMVLTYSYNFDK